MLKKNPSTRAGSISLEGAKTTSSFIQQHNLSPLLKNKKARRNARAYYWSSTRDQKFCEKETIQTLAIFFDNWHGMDNDISSPNMVSKIFCLLLSWFIVVSNSSTYSFIFPMHPSSDTTYTSSTKRHVVYILWILFNHHNRQRIKP